jgi:phosphoribosylformylglycinamidine cyclo-ligase
VRRDSWSPAGVFRYLAGKGNLARTELESAFNLGIGMVAVVARDRADAQLDYLRSRGVPSWIFGTIKPGSGQVEMIGDYAGWPI